ncbi:MAG: DUF3106 domain-containing protein [Polaromonas sp.]
MIVRTALVHAQLCLDRLPRFRQQVTVARDLLRLHQLAPGLLVAGLLILPGTGFAQATKPAAAAASKPSVATPPKPSDAGQSWAELTPMQQQALNPLGSRWNTISEAQKRKWLKISKNYPLLSPEEQATLHSRMHEWVSLSPQQRAQARLNFGKTKELSRQLTAEEKKAKWQAYQALSAEEKQKLAAKASPEPKGTATAVKPVAPQKLAAVSPHPNRPASKPVPKKITLTQPAPDSQPAERQR